MAVRQLWAFLTDVDVAALLAALERRDPGVVASSGRYLRGSERDLLDDPARLERRESLPGEARLYLFHRKHSTDLVVHEQPEGPFAGWKQIDEERSDCLVLRTRQGPAGELEPAKLYGYVNYWRAADKVRKKPLFSVWTGQTLKWLATQWPASGIRFLRLGEDAARRARRGELRLTYLLRTIPLEAHPGLEGIAAPEGTVTGDEPEPD